MGLERVALLRLLILAEAAQEVWAPAERAQDLVAGELAQARTVPAGMAVPAPVRAECPGEPAGTVLVLAVWAEPAVNSISNF